MEPYKTKTHEMIELQARIKKQNEDLALYDEITTWTRVNKVIQKYQG